MTETERIYDQDAYTKEFEAVVLACREEKGGYRILLDRSAFYPEGGGQPADRGYLNETEVWDVHEKDGELLHYTKEPLEVGTKVHGRIDWDRRFDLMQQHSGEHMVSGCIHEAYGYENVGFHMGSDVITIDLSGPLDKEQLQEIEQRVNQKIWENREVEISYPSEEELKLLPYRSKKELTGKIRIVTFPETDICACCGTHVKRTGEIGMVKLLSVVKFHEGVRIEMICGDRVLRYLNQIEEQNHSVSVKLSAKPEQTFQAVERLWEENAKLKLQVSRMQEEQFQQEAEKYKEQGNVLIFKAGLEADAVRKLTDAVMQSCKGRCAVFSDNGDGTCKYAMGEVNGQLQQLTRDLNRTLNGRGGGKPFFVQGSVSASEEEIRNFFQGK